MAHSLQSPALFDALWHLSKAQPSAAALLRLAAKRARKRSNRRKLREAAREVECVIQNFHVATGDESEMP